MVVAICERCGKEYKTFNAWLKRNPHHYCSRTCRSKSIIQPNFRKELICVICDKKYTVRRYRKDISKCCSKDCQRIYVGKLISGINHPNWKNGVAERPHKVKVWSENVKKRDNYTCVECGSEDNIESHHIIEFSSNENLKYDINNGITLCSFCHSEKHPNLKYFILSKYNKEIANGIRKET